MNVNKHQQIHARTHTHIDIYAYARSGTHSHTGNGIDTTGCVDTLFLTNLTLITVVVSDVFRLETDSEAIAADSWGWDS